MSFGTTAGSEESSEKAFFLSNPFLDIWLICQILRLGCSIQDIAATGSEWGNGKPIGYENGQVIPSSNCRGGARRQRSYRPLPPKTIFLIWFRGRATTCFAPTKSLLDRGITTTITTPFYIKGLTRRIDFIIIFLIFSLFPFVISGLFFTIAYNGLCKNSSRFRK